MVRLTGVFRAMLGSALPPGVRLEPAQPTCTEPQFVYHPSYRWYTVDGSIRRADGDSGFFQLRVFPTGTDEAMAELCSGGPDELSCESKDYPDGATAVVRVNEFMADGRQLWALLSRPDGTSVQIMTNNLHHEVIGNQVETTLTADEPLLTLDQLVTIARTPGLTLYP
ncbi:hypothetical protein [Micromonospora sp. C95]|uniref:hypothetical protein n=1 Tax=Micromonospora sp. C95 TaxID=2824882 RepID=UPI001B37B31B|nr:hypothetical protein [Micromonospora sp. C95]MBQ1023237.1 hypothetical protein [Micromonospora sp. C95]